MRPGVGPRSRGLYDQGPPFRKFPRNFQQDLALNRHSLYANAVTTAFPAGLDNFTNPNHATDNLNTAGVLHDDQHANANDAIEALEASLGVTASAVTGSVRYLLNSALSTLSGVTTTVSGSALSTGVASLVVVVTGSNAAQQIVVGAGLSGVSSATGFGSVTGSAYQVQFSVPGVASGTYNFATITVDSYGRLLSASTGTVAAGGGHGGEVPLYNSTTIGFNAYYCARTCGSSNTTSTLAGLKDIILGASLVAARSCTFNKFMCKISNATASGLGRVGVYAETSASDGRPSALVIGSAAIDCSTAVNYTETLGASYSLVAGTRYWLVVTCNDAAIQFLSFPASEIYPVWGMKGPTTTDIYTRWGFQVSSAYAALPNTFPGGGVPIGPNEQGTCPNVGIITDS